MTLWRTLIELTTDCHSEHSEESRTPDASGQSVGFVEISIRADHVEGTLAVPVPYLEGWYVREAYRGASVGRALIDFVEQWARVHGFSELASDAELENALSIKLHARLGFREVGRSVHFVKRIAE